MKNIIVKDYKQKKKNKYWKGMKRIFRKKEEIQKILIQKKLQKVILFNKTSGPL
jgi:hypothetical protein